MNTVTENEREENILFPPLLLKLELNIPQFAGQAKSVHEQEVNNLSWLCGW